MNKNIKLFGDFIGESASKSEKLTLIRGEGSNATGNVDLFGRGLYLTDDIEVAKFYGDTIVTFEIIGKIFDTSKTFSSIELRKICQGLDIVLNTNEGTKYLQDIIDYHGGRLPKDTDVDYIGMSWGLESRYDFNEVLKKNNLNTNDFNVFANTCTAMNMALCKMGYVGLRYSTSEIEDLEEVGLDRRNAYVIFDTNAIKKV